jgi:hypothetical protein
MRKSVLAAALLSGFIVVGATPATAAAPEREKRSGDFTSLFSGTNDCISNETGAGQTCTDIFLSARTDTSGQGSVEFNIQTYSISEDGDFTPIGSEYGFSTQDVVLTVTEELDATLAPTAITLQAVTCTPQGCQHGGSREVLVSAADSAVGPAVQRRERGSFREGKCTYRYTRTSTSAPVEGTITIDGVTYLETGSAEFGQYRVTQSCK